MYDFFFIIVEKKILVDNRCGGSGIVMFMYFYVYLYKNNEINIV